jgi:TonB-dependent SusC/RagA subfamily outer membrane receptor
MEHAPGTPKRDTARALPRPLLLALLLLIITHATSAAPPAGTSPADTLHTGLFTRDAGNFAGAAVVLTSADLRRLGSRELWEGLRLADPSFDVVESPVHGSDPNRAPAQRVRGATASAGIDAPDIPPALPLFVLDGMETTADRVRELDLDRVACVTILKDAAAKAIYGSRAANGVVVIETLSTGGSRSGLQYTGEIILAKANLDSYNLANAAEKLQAEIDAGLYTTTNSQLAPYIRQQREHVQALVDQGINTNWLEIPLRVGIGHRHALRAVHEGARWSHALDLSHRHLNGVMKGSGKRLTAAAYTLARHRGRVTWRNILDVRDRRSTDSPLGKLSDYSKLNPYWSPRDASGGLLPVLGDLLMPGSGIQIPVPNPLLDATIGTGLDERASGLSEHLHAEWRPLENLRVGARLLYTNEREKREEIYPAGHTGTPRGAYAVENKRKETARAALTFNYSGTAGRHHYFAGIEGGWYLEKTTHDGIATRGASTPHDLATADAWHTYTEKERADELYLVAVANYAYDRRYVIDLSCRLNDYTFRAAPGRQGHFGSVGAAWNLHEEPLLKSLAWLKQLKLRASAGRTATPDDGLLAHANPAANLDVARFHLTSPDITATWLQVKEFNAGADIAIGNILVARVDYYVDRRESHRFASPASGYILPRTPLLTETRHDGLEIFTRARLAGPHLSIFLSAAKERARLANLPDALVAATNLEKGQPLHAAWAIPSVGIDTASGREIFRQRDGQSTYAPAPHDQVLFGDITPDLRGHFGIDAAHRGFRLHLSFGYRLGALRRNQTVRDRVETVDIHYNVDRRRLAAPWNTRDALAATPHASSRHWERDDELSLSNLTLTHLWTNLPGGHLPDEAALTFTATDLLRLTTVRDERGTDYPLARTYSLRLRLVF